MIQRWQKLSVSGFRIAVLCCTLAFRCFLVAIIMAFLVERSGWSEVAILGGAVASLVTVFAAFFTLRRVCGWGGRIEQAWGVAFTLGCIVLAVSYAIGIQQSFGYWGYTAFGFFVALLFALDLVLVKPRA